MDAAVLAFTKHLSGPTRILENGSAGNIRPPKREREDALTREERSDSATTVVLEGDYGTLVKVGNRYVQLCSYRASNTEYLSRDLPILRKKVHSSTLVVHSVSSLDDAIDFANAAGEPLLASYHFGTPAVAKYTSQFIGSRASFINHIPVELSGRMSFDDLLVFECILNKFTVGPAAPLGYATSAIDRYRPEMFSVAEPHIVLPSELSATLEIALSSSSVAKAPGLRQLALAPLAPTGQGSGKVVGFFDQGLITGATILLTPVVGGVTVAGYLCARFAIRRWMSP